LANPEIENVKKKRRGKNRINNVCVKNLKGKVYLSIFIRKKGVEGEERKSTANQVSSGRLTLDLMK